DIASLTRQMREGSFDLCVDMQGSIRSALIGRLAGAERFVGLQDIREKPARWLYYETVKTRSRHEVESRCELLSKAVGEPLLPGKVQFPIDECEEERCEKLLQDLGVGNNYVLMAPTAGWGAKQWPAERFGAVATELNRRGFRIVLNASSKDDATA